MQIEDFDNLLKSVADQMSAPDFFPATMPENDLHPDPAALQAQIVSLRYRVEALEKYVGMPHVIAIRTS